MRRLALLIGNTIFNNTEAFPKLRTPANDVRDFGRILQQYGDFKILDTLVDANCETINQRIEQLFSQAEQDDLLLLYYSGHGYRGADGRHYLVAANTQPNLPQSTGIRESFIHDVMNNSRSRQRVVIFDCCFSGAFIEGRKSGPNGSLLVEELKGQAEAILASSGPIQDSFEGKDRNSLFTKFLLEGIKTGQADQNQDGQITVDELFNYADQKVRAMRPEQKPIRELNNSQISLAKSLAKKQYHLARIRVLLIRGFSGDELRDFCFDTPNFKQVYYKLGEHPAKDDIVDDLLEYAEQHKLLDALLMWTQETNLAQYDEHAPYFELILGSADFSDPPAGDDGPPPKAKSMFKAVRIPAFSSKPMFINAIAGIAIVALIVISAFNLPFSKSLFRATPTPLPPPPRVVVEVLGKDFGPDGANRPREGKPIAVGPRVFTVGHTEFIQGYDRHVWLFICKRQAEIACDIVPLEQEWEEFVYVGDPGMQDECAIFEASFVVVDAAQNAQILGLPHVLRKTDVALDALPTGLDRARFQIRRELNEYEDFISC